MQRFDDSSRWYHILFINDPITKDIQVFLILQSYERNSIQNFILALLSGHNDQSLKTYDPIALEVSIHEGNYRTKSRENKE